MTQRIAIILPTLSQTIEQDIVRGIQQNFKYQRIKSIFMPIGYLDDENHFDHQQLWLVQQLENLNIDGVILYGGGIAYKTSEKVMQIFVSALSEFPMINIGSLLANIPSVLVDNYWAMFQITQRLLDNNCQNFVYIDGPKDNFEAQQRSSAVVDALAKAKISLYQSNHLYGDMTTARARELCKQWLSQNNQLPCAIICANDLTAKGVIEELQQQHISVPQQVKVTGFDNFEYADSMQPSLSTAIYPAQDLGALAAQLMVKLLQGEEVNLEYQINTQPIFRESCGSQYNKFRPSSTKLQIRQIIQQRDSFAQRLTVTRLLHQRTTLMDVLQNAQSILSELGIPEIYIYQLEFDDKGRQYFHLSHSLQAQDTPNERSLIAENASDILLLSDNHQSLWVLTELKNNEHHFGYMLALTDPVHSDFIEFIAPQISDIINHQRLISNTKQYQEQVQLNEKMASLGSLVSGIAHEINTPLGNTLLAASHLAEQINKLNQEAKDKRLSKTIFDTFINDATLSSDIILKSSQRAAELITSFKHVSVDLSYEELRTINLANYIEDVLRSLQHQLKNTSISLKTNLDNNIQLQTYPGAIAQVINNLFNNALLHGFENKKRSGTINISLEKGVSHHTLTLSDDGKGASNETMKHMFEPFYTTARNNGGCGLGMHIVFNIVTQKLQWLLDAESRLEEGFRITMLIPASA